MIPMPQFSDEEDSSPRIQNENNGNKKFDKKSKYHVDGYSDMENMWKFVYQLK